MRAKNKRIVPRRQKGKAAQKSANSQPDENASPIDIEQIRQWIEANVEKMVTVRNLKNEISNLNGKKDQIETEIEEEQKYYSEISIKKEKAIMRKGKLNIGTDEGEALLLDRDIEEYDTILKKNQENIEALEDKTEYYNKKIIEVESTIEEVNNEEIAGLKLNEVNSVQSAKTLLIAFFNLILEIKVQKVELEETIIDQHNTLQNVEKELKILRESKKTSELDFNRALQKREKEFRELESKLLEETESAIEPSEHALNSSTQFTALEAKRLEKKNSKAFPTSAYENSKRQLSKMMSQLERKLVKEEKK